MNEWKNDYITITRSTKFKVKTDRAEGGNGGNVSSKSDGIF
jgi:hypothetical protein